MVATVALELDVGLHFTCLTAYAAGLVFWLSSISFWPSIDDLLPLSTPLVHFNSTSFEIFLLPTYVIN